MAPKLSWGVEFRGVAFKPDRGVPLLIGVPNFFWGVLPNSPLIGGPPGFSEGVLICEAGVVGVRKPLAGLLWLGFVDGVVAELMVLNDLFSLVGDITLFEAYKYAH